MSVKDIRISISIVIYELDKAALANCLDSLRTAIESCDPNLGTINWQAKLIDNGNNERSLSPFISENLSIVKNFKNVGYGAAHNQAIMMAHSDFHLILNPDVILDPGYLQYTIKFMISDENTVLACPYGVNSKAENAYLCKRYPSLLALLIRGLDQKNISQKLNNHLARYEYHDLTDSKVSKVELISGCCMFARTVSLQRAGGFDIKFFLYFEDFDLSLRMRQLGNVVFIPDAKIVHFGGKSAQKGLLHILFFIRSAGRFFNKHGWQIV